MLLGSAVSQATKLTTAVLSLSLGKESLARGIRGAPALANLELHVSKQHGGAGRESLAPLIWLMPPTLTALGLRAPFPNSLPRPSVKTMFVRLPRLRTLHTSLDAEMLIQGMLDAGPSALPDLRRVEFNGIVERARPLRRFLHKFPTLTLRFGPVDSEEVSIEEYTAYWDFARCVGFLAASGA